MMMTAIPISEAIDEAVDFARGAWREAWAPMVATSLGWMLIVVGAHAQIGPQAANLSQTIGWGLELFNLPLLGALYRRGVGGRAHRGLGPGGLQLGGAEWRLLAVNLVLGFFCLLACLPLVILSGLSFVLFHRLGGVTLGPLGHWAWWFLFSIVFWAGLIGWLIYVCARLSLATALSVEWRRILPFTGWLLTEGQGRTIVVSFILAKAPTLAVVLALSAFGWIESSDVPIGLHGPWPVLDAIGAGAVAGVVLSVLQAPLSVGLLAFFYDALAPADAENLSAAELEVEAAPPSEPEEPPVIPELPDPPFSTVEYFPHTGRFSRIAAPWLADESVPELYAHLVELDREREDDPSPEIETFDHYPHSIVEYSPHTGRFSRLFSPWLNDNEPPSVDRVEDPVVETAPLDTPDLQPFPAAALDDVGEAEHAKL